MITASDHAIWLDKHIPHRVRAAIARLKVDVWGVTAAEMCVDPPLPTKQSKACWRCSTDSIWEGRLVAARWLIEFVGIQQDPKGKAVRSRKSTKYSSDVRINDLPGGILLDPNTNDAEKLAKVWKGCSQGSSHATDASGHPSVDDRRELPKAVSIVIKHLEQTVYHGRVGETLRELVLGP